MTNEGHTIKSFTDLDTWKEGHKLVLEIYRITEQFPRKELFVLTTQMRRCAISITSNVSEGFSRKTDKEKYQFYTIAQGSLTELQNQLIIARDIKYMDNDEFQKLAQQSITVSKLINGLKRLKNTKY